MAQVFDIPCMYHAIPKQVLRHTIPFLLWHVQLQLHAFPIQAWITKEHFVNANNTRYKKLDIHVNYNDKTHPIMYWFLKMHKTPIGLRFIVASKTFNTKHLSIVSKIFKIIKKKIKNYQLYKIHWLIHFLLSSAKHHTHTFQFYTTQGD